MDKRALYTYFSVKINRDNMIKKIDDKERMKRKFDFEADETTDKRHKEVLLNWKKKTKMERMKFVNEVLESPRDEAYDYVAKKKIEINKQIGDIKGNVYDKIKSISKIFDEDNNEKSK